MLPLATAIQLSTVETDPYVAAHLFATFGGPYAVALCVFFGLAPGLLLRTREPTRAQLLRASTMRAVVLTGVMLGSLWLLVDPDMSIPTGPTWRLLMWLCGLALPLWANTLFLRLRGMVSLSAVLATIGVGAVFAGGVLLIGVALVLPPAGMIVPIALGGGVYATGIAVACWTDVTGAFLKVVMSVSALSAVISIGVAVRIANPPIDTVQVSWFEAWDPHGQRAVFMIERPPSQLRSFVEYDLRTDTWRNFGRRVERVTYAMGHRVVARRPPVSYTLDTDAYTTLCAEDGQGEERCGPTLRAGRGLLLRGHDRAPLAVANRRRGLVVWNVQSDQRWSIRRDGARIRWPCFVDGPGLYWRVDHGEPPFQQELLMLDEPDAEVRSLTLRQSSDCASVGRVAPEGRFVRGRGSVGRASRLFGPGMPEEGVDLEGLVTWSSWSDDGTTLGLIFDPPMVAYWTAETGMSGRFPMPNAGRLEMAPDGRHVAYLTEDGHGRGHWSVYRVPEHQLVSRGSFESQTVRWDDDGHLITIQGGQLVRLDPFAATTEVLFPPPR